MTHRIVRILVAILAVPALVASTALTTVSAKDEVPDFEVLVLGTYHAPGMFLAEKYTPGHIRATLIAAGPDVVAVESHPAWFAKGRYHVVTYEAEGVAVPWAREKKLPAYGVDWKDIDAWERMEEGMALADLAQMKAAGGHLHASHYGWIPEHVRGSTRQGQASLRNVDWLHINGVHDDAWAKSRFGGKNPEQEDFIGRRDRGIAENCVEVMKKHQGKRLVVVVGAHHKPFLDIHFGRMKGVRVLKLGKDVDVPSTEAIAAAWTPDDLVNALAYELDAGSRYFHKELVDLDHARDLLGRLRRTKQRPVAFLYFKARIHMHADEKDQALVALRACAREADDLARLYPFPMREWKMRFSAADAVAIQRARLAEEPEALREIIARYEGRIADLEKAPGQARRVETIKDAGFEADGRASDFFDGWATYLSERAGMLRFSGDASRKREGKRSLRVEVTRASEIQWPFEVRQEVSVPTCNEDIRRITFGLQVRGEKIESATLAALPAYFATNRTPLAEQTVKLTSGKWAQAEVSFDLPPTRKFSLFVRFTGPKGARLWLDAGTPLPVTYTTVDDELPRLMKAKMFLEWVQDRSPIEETGSSGGGAAVGLSDAGFESGALAASPISGWYSTDEKAKIVKVSADTKDKKEGAKSLRFEVLKAKAGAPVNISQTRDLPPGESFELSIQLRAEKLGWVRVQVGYWKDNTHFEELASHMEPAGTGAWSKATLRFTPPKGKRKFSIFILFPGHPGGVLSLDDAKLEAVP